MWRYTPRITWFGKFIVSARKNARTRSSDSIDWLAPFAILDCGDCGYLNIVRRAP